MIIRRNDRLFSKDAFGDSVEMMAYKTDGFFLKDMPVKLDFERRAKGEIHAATITGTDWLTAKEIRIDSSLAPQRKIIKLQDSFFDKYTGEYEVSTGFIIKVWRDRNDRYMVTSSLHGDFEIFAETDTEFFIPDAGVDLQFVNDEENAPALIVMMGGKTNKGRKIK